MKAITITVAFLAAVFSAGAAAGQHIPPGMEQRVLDLLKPYGVDAPADEVLPGILIDKVGIDKQQISIVLKSSAGTAVLTLTPATEGASADVNTPGFAITFDEGARSTDFNPAATAVVAAIRNNDSGDFWNALPAPADLTPPAPPPSAGGIVLRQILAASEIFNLAAKPYRHPSSVHFYVEATRRAYADRNGLLGDPDVVSIPSKLLELDYIRSRLSDIDPKRATPSSEVKPGKLPKRASEQTTHFSVIDGHGNAVANTTTLNTGFGSKFVIPAAGVLLNNEMDDFSVKPGSANVYGLVQSEPNAIAPNKRMLSSMTPTIVLRDKQVRAVLGSPGGPTISTTVAQLLMALLDHDERIDAAVAAPRIHHQWLPDQIYVERTVAPSLITALRSRGHRVKKRGSIGNANCIEVDPVGRGFRAVADTARGGGVALAY